MKIEHYNKLTTDLKTGKTNETKDVLQNLVEKSVRFS